jgi:dipeptidyl aminopeptidase/acylaminoacyl peptidase
MAKIRYIIYIPEEGHWPIKGRHANEKAARKAYLKWAKRKRLPKGSNIIPVLTN